MAVKDMVSSPVPMPTAIFEDSFIERFWSKVDTSGEDQCWNWKASVMVKRGGYGQVSLKTEGHQRLLKAHRVAYALANPKSNMVGLVCHKCNNPLCCNPSHLYLGTPLDNASDMRKAEHGVHMVFHGEDNPKSKLTWDDVLNIRESTATGRYLAALYKVSPTTISKIRRGLVWREKGSTSKQTW